MQRRFTQQFLSGARESRFIEAVDFDHHADGRWADRTNDRRAGDCWVADPRHDDHCTLERNWRFGHPPKVALSLRMRQRERRIRFAIRKRAAAEYADAE